MISGRIKGLCDSGSSRCILPVLWNIKSLVSEEKTAKPPLIFSTGCEVIMLCYLVNVWLRQLLNTVNKILNIGYKNGGGKGNIPL